MQLDIAHPCCGQLTAVKTGYLLTSIVWPYRGFTLRAFFNFPSDPLLVFKLITVSTPSGLLCNGYKLIVWNKLQTCLRELRLWFWLSLYTIVHLLVIVLICLVYVSRWTKYLTWVFSCSCRTGWLTPRQILTTSLWQRALYLQTTLNKTIMLFVG